MDIQNVKGGKKMKKEYFTRYILENGKIRKLKVDKEIAIKEIKELLDRDKEFLEIMSKM